MDYKDALTSKTWIIRAASEKMFNNQQVEEPVLPPVQEPPVGFGTQQERLAVRTLPTWRVDHDQETVGQTAEPTVSSWLKRGTDI